MDRKKENFLTVYRAQAAIVSKAIDAAGISRTTFHRWRREDPEFDECAAEIEEAQIDFAESKLLEAINAGDVRAITFYLKCKGKQRGWSETAQKQEPQQPGITVQHGQEIEVEVKDKTIKSRIEYKQRNIVKLLKEQGKYTADLTYQVRITASLLVRAELLADEIFAPGHNAVNSEFSREGNTRESIAPKERLYLEVARSAQKALTALGMNTEGKAAKPTDDNFNEFLNQFKDSQ